MFEENAHWRLVGEGAILLIEAEVIGVKMDHQGRRVAGELLEDVFVGDD
jgi:hypothetical protein